MIPSMDLNASPEPEEDGVFPELQSEEDNGHVDHEESGASIARREREERTRRMRSRQHPDDRLFYAYQPSQHDGGYQAKRQRPNSRLPQGWLDCPAYGNEIERIIPSKVPLGESFNEDIPHGKRYSSKQVIQKQRVLKRNIGLVIDLTNTSRYYNPNDWNKEGIKHVKIACKGRDSVPENEAVNEFVFEVSQFVDQQRQKQRQVQGQGKKYILVHCTHGHNRTGYMIAHYLMRTKLISITDAIKIFSNARPPGIYKPDYIDALYSFYHEKKPEDVVCPSTPEWKRSSDLDLNGDAVPDDDDDEHSTDPPDATNETHTTLTNDDILGDKIPCEQEINFRQFVYQMMKLPGGKGEMYHNYTLLDGEMVIDTLPNTRKQARRYLVYDMMAINRNSLVELPFCERWKMVEQEIIEPRNSERQQMVQNGQFFYRYDLETFGVRRKAFWLLSTVIKVLKTFIPGLSHEADGLIFQGWDDPYVPRTHEGLLKWKYPEMNSVDFLFEIVESRQLLYLNERGKKKLMNKRVVFPDDGPEASAYSGKIIECSWNSEKDAWVCMRVRVDKGTPNEFNTYRKVMKSINDNITEDVLLSDINEIIRLPMYADRIQNESKVQPSSHCK